MRRFGYLFLLLVTLALSATTVFAQDGKLKIKVTPRQADVFVDGQAQPQGVYPIKLSAGKHTVVVVNYGYKIFTQDVNVDAGKTTELPVTLEAYGGTVNGPFGDVQFVGGSPRAAVLSNGTTPGLFCRPCGRIRLGLDLAPEFAPPCWNAPHHRYLEGNHGLVGRRHRRCGQESDRGPPEEHAKDRRLEPRDQIAGPAALQGRYGQRYDRGRSGDRRRVHGFAIGHQLRTGIDNHVEFD